MSQYKNGFNLYKALIDLTKPQLLTVYRWAAINDIDHIKLLKDTPDITIQNIEQLSTFTNNDDDNDLYFNIVNLNLTDAQQTTIYNMIQMNEIKKMEQRKLQYEYQKKHRIKVSNAKEPKIKQCKICEPVYCKICDTTVKNYYIHTKTKLHQQLDKLINEKNNLTQLITV